MSNTARNKDIDCYIIDVESDQKSVSLIGNCCIQPEIIGK